ncbi:MAG: TonB-dependent hemoglobin/transferrin/lactoferrin family receptor [Helicobacteraceae bacterium]
MKKITVLLPLFSAFFVVSLGAIEPEGKAQEAGQVKEGLAQDLSRQSDQSAKSQEAQSNPAAQEASGAGGGDEKLDLEDVKVVDEQEDDPASRKVGEIRKSAKTLSSQQVSDSRDLVRYETGVTVVEGGRFGASGYAVRGVDENRVAITIDGLRQSETLGSQGFKELFEGYGNFNNTRNGVEMENVKMATITKGADSFKTGSGALGGSVMFETKDARDFFIDKDYYASYKYGYQSMNSQHTKSMTLAGRYRWFDALFIHTSRKGHEVKNYFYDIYSEKEDRNKVGKEREKADPYTITRESNLLKIGFSPSETRRFSVFIDDSSLNSRGEDLSYVLRPSTHTNQFVYGQRKNDDTSKRRNIQYAYEDYTQTPLWDSLKISYSTQKIKNNARTDEYCSGSECKNVQNPQGLHLEEDGGVYRVVDKNGKELQGKDPSFGSADYYSGGKKLENNKDYKEYDTYAVGIDCDKIDCSKKFRVFQVEENSNYTLKWVDRDIEVKTLPSGKKYGLVKKVGDEELKYVLPGTSGHETDYYNDRDLDTNTKQLNLALEKEFSFFTTEHLLKYGAFFDVTDKSMVNKDGFKGGNVQWWADKFFGMKSEVGPGGFEYIPKPEYWVGKYGNEGLRERTGTKDTYLIPVTTKSKAYYISDDLHLTKWLGFDLNYRYDEVEHTPKYNKNIPVPRGLITGIFVPLDSGCNPYQTFNPNDPSDPTTQCVNKNFEANLKHLLRKAKFTSDSYSLAVNLDPVPFARFQVKYSKGFRAPTSDEMYMTFKHPSFSIRPNTRLKAEIAKTKEAALTFYKRRSFVTLSAFETNYKDFIDLVFIGEKPVDLGSAIGYPFWQSVNIDRAKVNGFEVSSHADLGDFISSLKGFRLGYKLTSQKGRMNDTIPMNAIQPLTAVYTFGYSTPGDKYGVDFFVTSVAAKKKEDTYNMYWESQKNASKTVQGKPVTDSTLAWRNSAYTVLDAIAYANPVKYLTVSFGLYNILNAKYMTWDMARSIRAFGTSNLINQDTGAGIGRFYAPKRNFKLNMEARY